MQSNNNILDTQKIIRNIAIRATEASNASVESAIIAISISENDNTNISAKILSTAAFNAAVTSMSYAMIAIKSSNVEHAYYAYTNAYNQSCIAAILAVDVAIVSQQYL